MAYVIYDTSPFSARDATGAPLSGAKLWFTQTGTDTPVTVYANKTGGATLTNPVVADSNGKWPGIWLNDNNQTRVRYGLSTASTPLGPWIDDKDGIIQVAAAAGLLTDLSNVDADAGEIQDFLDYIGVSPSSVFETRADASAATIPAAVTTIVVLRHTTNRPVCRSVYKEVTDSGSLQAWQFRSNSNSRRWELASERVSVTELGAIGNDSGDELTYFTDAIAYLSARRGGDTDEKGGTIYVPPGTYRLSNKITLPYQTALVGESLVTSILLFTAATDGVELYDASFNLGMQLENLCIRTAHANCGKAISIPAYSIGCSNILIRNVLVNSEDPNTYRWDYGLWGENFQNGRIESLLIYYSTKTGISLTYACNANTYVGCEVVGLTADSEYGVVQNATGSGGGSLTFEDYWYGVTVQGSFANACWKATGASPKVTGVHFENLDPSPSDGADIYLVGGIVNASFSAIEGGSLLTSGTIRNLALSDGQMNDLNFAANAWATLKTLRYGTLTQAATALVTSIGCSTSGGAQRANPILDPVRYLSAISTISDGSATPTVPDSEVCQFNNAGATNVTSLLGGREGQMIVFLGDTVTTLVDGGNMRLNGNMAFTANDTITLILLSSVWFEVARSVN